MINKLYTIIKEYIKNNIGFIITLLVIILVFQINLPWSIYAPGGIISIDKRLSGSNYKSDGSINLTYVTFIKGNIPSLLMGLILPSWDIVDNDDLKSSNEELEDANKRNVIYLYESISNATYVAYNKAQIEPNITDTSYYLFYKDPKSKTDLKIGDKITKCDDKKITSLIDLVNYIENTDKESVKLEYIRDDKTYETEEQLYRDSNGSNKLGVAITTIYSYDNKPNIKYHEDESEAGSSGGLMLTLAYYNALVEEDITRGKKICGTGTISLDGTVGEIAGIKYKLAGASKNKCDVFLVPTDNYKEAIKEKKDNNYQINIIESINFDQVLEELKKL